ncbi:MAG: transposase [Cenarchaeum sp. SB0677_bin_16]|nr:transposase [Cenarchaeum sp. SB0677_bin_16]
MVSPSYTSQMCHTCGNIDRNNCNLRKFLCTMYDHAAHVDHNAVCNIKARFWAEVAKGHNRASKHCTANTHGKGCLGVEGSICQATTSVMVRDPPMRRQAEPRVVKLWNAH